MTSERFDDAFVTEGGPYEECGFCGHTHIAADGHFDDGEREDLEKLSSDEPLNYTLHEGCDSISFGFLGGKKFIPACACSADGAKGPGPNEYEAFIWENRNEIAGYLKEETKVQKAVADFNHAIAHSIPDIMG